MEKKRKVKKRARKGKEKKKKRKPVGYRFDNSRISALHQPKVVKARLS